MLSSPIEHPPLVSIDEVKGLVASEFQAVDSLIIEHLYSQVPLIEEITQHILQSGGKRLRPLIVLLTAKIFDYSGQDHIALAAVVEFLHTATLLHDDVVDDSSLRRGQPTANNIWGNAASVLVGDFIYSRTFEILIRLKNSAVMNILARTTNAIAEGEVLQLVKRNDPSTNEADYMKVVSNKTAPLFQAAAEVAALICERPAAEQKLMATYGLQVGMAFQLVDDALDYMSSSEQLGKNIGDDLAEGKTTLPLIHAMANASPGKSEIIKEAIRSGGLTNLDVVIQAIQETNSIEYTFSKAAERVELALNAIAFLPQSLYKQGLETVAYFALNRKF